MQDYYNLVILENISKNLNIFESRGVNDKILPLIETLWNVVINQNPISVNGLNLIRLDNLNVDCEWLNNFRRLTIEWGENRISDSKFYSFSDETAIEGGKLVNVYMHISISELTKMDFQREMMHELHHAYRNYCFLKQDETVWTQERDRLVNLSDTLSNNINNDIHNSQIRYAFYLSEKDEINARASELYPFILNNSQITRNNFREYIESTNAIKSINALKTLLRRYFDLNLDNGIKELIGNIITQTIPQYSNLDNIQAFQILRKRIVNAISYGEHQNYKVISNALQKAEELDNNRKPKEIALEEYSQWKDILNEKELSNVINALKQLNETKKLILKM